MTIYVDGDGCPVKDEVYRVARRYELRVFVVANVALRVPSQQWVEAVVVKGNLDAADDWIVEHIEAGDIAVTTDIPLADRCLQKKAVVVAPTGRPFTDKSIGGALASRELMQTLRQTGAISGGPAPFRPTDRSRFLNVLDAEIQKLRRA